MESYSKESLFGLGLTKISIIGDDYPKIFVTVEEYCAKAGINIMYSNADLGIIKIAAKENGVIGTFFTKLSQPIIFYQALGRIVIEFPKFPKNLANTIEIGLQDYIAGRYVPHSASNAIIPDETAKVDRNYAFEAKVIGIGILAWILFLPLIIGWLVSIISGSLTLAKIYCTREKKGQGTIYVAFIIGSIFTIIFLG